MNAVIRSGQSVRPPISASSSIENDCCGQTRHPALFCMDCDKLALRCASPRTCGGSSCWTLENQTGFGHGLLSYVLFNW